MMDVKIIQIVFDDGDTVLLLSNGKIFRRTTSADGPYYWVEEKYLDKLVEYLGEEKITN